MVNIVMVIIKLLYIDDLHFSDEATASRLQGPEVVLQSLQITRSFYFVNNKKAQIICSQYISK